MALTLALQQIRDGVCDAALVCGFNLTISIITAIRSHRLGVTSQDGACKTFDESGKEGASVVTECGVLFGVCV